MLQPVVTGISLFYLLVGRLLGVSLPCGLSSLWICSIYQALWKASQRISLRKEENIFQKIFLNHLPFSPTDPREAAGQELL